MRRAVITGLGIVSPIGNNAQEVLLSLKNCTSGIEFNDEYKTMGFRSHVCGSIKLKTEELIDRRTLRFMGDGAAYNYIAMRQAIEDSGMETKDISNERTGIIMGSGGPSTRSLLKAFDITRKSGPKKMGPFVVPRTMSSTNSATLAVPYKIKGVNYSISSACSTSAHCIGHASELIQLGKQDIVFAGGGEELDWTMSSQFDAMQALSTKYNSTPKKASRAFDVNRDGFIIAGGGGTVVVEELEHAKARGAKIYAELTGYGATSDGYDMVQPSGEGAVRCMQMALSNIKEEVNYLNAHGTSTPIGDAQELKAIKQVFGKNIPTINSTKSLTGHSLGATGVHESIYSLLMMENNFICKSANIEELDPEAKNMPIATEKVETEITACISNSFGFGGTNASLVFQKCL